VKLCTVCGVATSRPGSRCTDHTRQSNRSRHNALYSTQAWQRLSARVLRAWRGEHGNWCPGYNRPAHPASDLTVDHVVPLTTGGAPFDVGNTAVLCPSCNSTKGASTEGGGVAHRATRMPADRLVPLAAGGAPFDIANTAVLCRSWNSAKGASSEPGGVHLGGKEIAADRYLREHVYTASPKSVGKYTSILGAGCAAEIASRAALPAGWLSATRDPPSAALDTPNGTLSTRIPTASPWRVPSLLNSPPSPSGRPVPSRGRLPPSPRAGTVSTRAAAVPQLRLAGRTQARFYPGIHATRREQIAGLSASQVPRETAYPQPLPAPPGSTSAPSRWLKPMAPGSTRRWCPCSWRARRRSSSWGDHDPCYTT
jgi:5-methylcytosine-specific restriction protein A